MGQIIKGLFIGAIGGMVLGFIVWLIGANHNSWWFHHFSTFVSIGGMIGGSINGFHAWILSVIATKEREEADKREHAAKQKALYSSLMDLSSMSKAMADELPQILEKANLSIDKAEEEFEEGVIPVFWDEVEMAANHLAQYEFHLQNLNDKVIEYRSKSQQLDSNVQAFPVSIKALPDSSNVAHRFRAVVRKAQKNFQFVSIYEQRKTNKLLVAGFSSLGEAIGGLGERLDNSLQQLTSSLSQANDLVLNELRQAREHLERDSEERREHEAQTRKMLDNIQRRRKPQ